MWKRKLCQCADVPSDHRTAISIVPLAVYNPCAALFPGHEWSENYIDDINTDECNQCGRKCLYSYSGPAWGGWGGNCYNGFADGGGDCYFSV